MTLKIINRKSFTYGTGCRVDEEISYGNVWNLTYVSVSIGLVKWLKHYSVWNKIHSFVNLSQFHSVFTQVKYWNEWWCHSTRIRRRFRRRNHESGRIDNNVVVTSAIFGRAKGKKWFGADEWKRLDVQQIVSLLSGIFPAPRWMGLKMKRDQLTHRIWRLSKAAGRIRWICGVIAAWQRFSEGENWEKNEGFIHSFQFLASFQGPYLKG